MEETTTLYDLDFTDVEIDEDYVDAMDALNYEDEVDNDEYIFGGYGTHFDCYSTFDADDYEYQQGLYL